MSEDFVPGPTDESYVDEAVESAGEAPESTRNSPMAQTGRSPGEVEADLRHEETAPMEQVNRD